ncbi:MAG: hypothetical protein OYI31_03425 [Chloroflexota bacterium]|nr:hypothetical protein [Chloroflexota bacterium]MDE2942202.1 hypothetical protein [Chloroflexota bacterium]MDE3267497.1 hypothetical protein [Chloroflexota bacterium]
MNADHHEITEVTRRAILDHLALSGIPWAGRLGEQEFLARLYDLSSMPSTDSRFRDADGDIWQHRVRNPNDWEDDWVFTDRRFDLLHATDDRFLRFLCETIHPVVRANDEEVGNLVYHYNQHLEFDGWQIIEGGKISGQRFFVPHKMGRRVQVLDEPVGWEKVQDLIGEARDLLQAGLYPRVGSACRDALIYVARELQAIAPETALGLQEGNVQGILEAFLKAKRPGKSNERLRAYARTPWNFAQQVQHDTEADYISAALCLEAVASTAAIAYLLATYDQGGDFSGDIDDSPF